MPKFGWVIQGFNNYRNPYRGSFFIWRGPRRVFAEWTASDAGDIPYAAPAALGAAPSQTGATTTPPQSRRSPARRGYPRTS
jgi:hypothetical protein